MYDQAQLIEKLGIEAMPEEKQEKIIEIATFRIGNAITENLSEQQFNEYKAIVDDDHAVIDAWLEQHAPEYKASPVYAELEAGAAEDPEKNNPAKLYASMAWVQLNVPNVEEVINSTLEKFKQDLAAS